MMGRFGLYSNRVFTIDGTKEATVIINDGIIESVEPGYYDLENIQDYGNAVIMPGLIDSHVHINEPGRTQWEGFNTATKAAAAGGITTLIDMPLNSTPVTTAKRALNQKIEAATGKIHVNCGFYGGIVPDNHAALEDLCKSGVWGIKAFLTHSGIDDFPNVTEQHLDAAYPIFKKYDVPLLVHAELDDQHEGLKLLAENPTNYKAFLSSRPKRWENSAIDMMIRLCEKYQAKTHIVHLSSDEGIEPIKRAIEKGLPISTETCPHYLYFNAEQIPDARTEYKCAPPIREKGNNERLWQAIKDGTISLIVTDHSPTEPENKELETGNLLKAWGGIAGLQFSLPATWTKAKGKGFNIEDIVRLMSFNVAGFLNLSHRKGIIQAGYDADITIWDPEKVISVTEERIQHRHKVTPYLGEKLQGEVISTFVSGSRVYHRGFFENLNKGKVLLKTYDRK